MAQRIDGTHTAAKVLEEVAHGVKIAVDEAVAWVEKKAEALSSESDSTGPYTSPATCVPSDLDPIACGALPAVLKEEENGEAIKENAAKNEDDATEAKEAQSDGNARTNRDSTQR